MPSLDSPEEGFDMDLRTGGIDPPDAKATSLKSFVFSLGSCCSPATKSSFVNNDYIEPDGSWEAKASSDYSTEEESDEVKEPVVITIDMMFDIPVDIQLIWYEWILYQLDECIDEHRILQNREGADGPPRRGVYGPLENMKTLEVQAEQRLIEDPGQNTYTTALKLRHHIEHDVKQSLEVGALYSALRIPKLLGDSKRHKKMMHVFDVITTKYAKSDSASSDSSPASSSSLDDDAFEKVYETITNIDFSYCPHFGLVHHFIESLKCIAFEWARCTHPEEFGTNKHYKLYSPSYWRDYAQSKRGSQCEGAKLAFPDKDPEQSALTSAFQGLVHIRNDFVHRGKGEPQPLIDEITSQGDCFGKMKRRAIKLALMLGDLDLAHKFDIKIRVLETGSEKDQNLAEFQRDGVEALVQDLMSGDSRKRESVLSGDFCWGIDPPMNAIRPRWASLDVLIAETEVESTAMTYEQAYKEGYRKKVEGTNTASTSDEDEADDSKWSNLKGLARARAKKYADSPSSDDSEESVKEGSEEDSEGTLTAPTLDEEDPLASWSAWEPAQNADTPSDEGSDKEGSEEDGVGMYTPPTSDEEESEDQVDDSQSLDSPELA